MNQFDITAAKIAFAVKRVTKLIVLLSLVPVSLVNAKDLPGTSPTSWSVSPSGAFNFQMGVEVPAGRNGLQPNLSINYSSSQGNGSLGTGWSISGLPAITRCGQTQAANQKTTGVNHSKEDRFCFGGHQLKMISGSVYGASGTEYRTEVEQFAKIVAVGSGSRNLNDTGRAPTRWDVWTKDGRKYQFGSNTNSRLDIPNSAGGNSVHAWYLRRVEDRVGNYYLITYRNQDKLPLRINYTYNSGVSAKQRIDYVYESRPDQRTNYIFGKAIPQLSSKTLRLEKLAVSIPVQPLLSVAVRLTKKETSFSSK